MNIPRCGRRRRARRCDRPRCDRPRRDRPRRGRHCCHRPRSGPIM